ncbi:MAG: hypothetical protein K6E62_03845 [Lachnospiraceae bacterium]|nr:hypothetical protein [Lachnospiraceae bacterium]
MKAEEKYKDIINLPHHVSGRHPQLGTDSYAAQFSPFAALTGYDGIVSEVARLTDERIGIGESEEDALNLKLQIIKEHIKEKPERTFVYFVPDSRKSGGEYRQKTACVKAIDEVERTVIFTDGTSLPLDDLTDIMSPGDGVSGSF